ncbi:acyltransferase family protein [Actinomadura alba]|uniref:Acyltransferase n=1 Tax=Actinomadura alba TaxID=406431 RepID=A0ABR7LLL7_9ACTN|nr:acyltransferase [Actinomadura alba]MBC6465724.1 acyltransferase [Actinomadura alba]
MSSSPLEPRTAHPPVGASAGSARLLWLDVLRGVAALTVALHHATYYYTPQMRAAEVFAWFNPGTYGVLVFFLISGYIVPASLERHGRVRDFWIGRFFRIYPLLTVVCFVGIVPYLLGVRGLRLDLEEHDPVIAILAHVTMLQDVLAVPNTINVLWTLSYEMAFYLLIVGFFVVGVHRRSVLITASLAVAALVLGAEIPWGSVSRAAGVGPTVVYTAVLLTLAIMASMSRKAPLMVAGGVFGGVLAIVLVAVNSRVGSWEGLMILAVMFTGTLVYRVEHGQAGKGPAALSVVTVLAGAVIFGPVNVLLAALTFAVAMMLRHRRMPRPLIGLGVISYSVYLLHMVLMMIYDQLAGPPERDDYLKLVIFTGVLLLVSWITHRCIEAPMQRLGRRLARRLRSDAARPVTRAGGDGPALAPAGAAGTPTV